MASSQYAAGAITPRKSASTRRADVFEDLPSKSHLVTVNPGSLYPRKVSHQSRRQDTSLTCIIVQFLDESDDVRSQYTDDGSYPFASPPADYDNSPKPGSSRSGQGQKDTTVSSFNTITPSEGFTVLSLLNSDPPSQSQSRIATPRSQDEPSQLDTFQQTESSTFVYQQPPGQPILWPLEHEQEATLLQHYIENVALFVGDNTPLLQQKLTIRSLTW
jgi:hypothetical protein